MTFVALSVRLGAAAVVLRLAPSVSDDRPALARGLAHVLWHDGRLVDPSLAQLVTETGREFARLGSAPVPTEHAIQALTTILKRLAPAAEVQVESSARRDGPIPLWPNTLRMGMPTPDRASIWPFDTELVGLQLGTRRMIKREALSESSAEADCAWLTSQGVSVRRMSSADADGRRVLFAGFDLTMLDDAIAAEASLRRRDGSSAAAARFLGEGLGYPTCCIDEFLNIDVRDDLTLIASLLGSQPPEPASPLSQWLNAPVALVSHTPCQLDCAPTLKLARQLLDELERRAPGFEARWLELAQRVHVLDEELGCIAFRALGSLRDAAVVNDAVRFSPPAGDDPASVVSILPEWFERRLSLDEQGRLQDDRGELRVIAAADHRG